MPAVTAELTDRVEKTGAQHVQAIVRHLSQDAPRLADLDEEQLEQLARVVVAETLKDELRQAADLERIPYAQERETTSIARDERGQSTPGSPTAPRWTAWKPGAPPGGFLPWS